MYANSRRALMLITVFLVSIMSPLATPIEPVEAHATPDTDDPPVRVKVYLNHFYSTRDLDDGGIGISGWDGDAELGFMSEVEHVGHGFSMYPEEIHWNMDQDDGPGVWGLGGNTDDRVEITRSPCWDTGNPHDLDSDCDGTADNQDRNDDNDEFDDVDDEYPNDPENNGKPGRQELVWNLQYDPPKLIYEHDECTPYSDVLFSYDANIISSINWWWYVEMTALIVAIGLLAFPTGGGSVAGGAAAMGGSFWMTTAAWTTVGIGAASVTASAWESFKENGEYLQSKVVDHKLEVGDNIIFPPDGFTANQGGPIGVNVTLEIEELYGDTDSVNPANGKRPCTDFSGDIEDSEQVDESDEEEEVGFQEARASVSDGFSQLRSLFASINESHSGNQEYWDSYYVKFPEEAPPSSNNSSSSNNGTYFNYNAQQWIDTYYNYSAQRRILMTGINGDVGDVTGDWLDRVTTVNPDELYGLNMDLWYAEDLTEGGHYYDALSYYESAIMGSIDAIENAPPPPPSTVMIQAGGDDIPEDLFIEIYSGDCGDDCAEGDLVFVGDEGDSEIETALESGEYTVVMISDGDVYSSEYLEVLSGESQSLVVGVSHAPVLDTLMYVQGMLIATIPALLGFTGSRRYIESEREEFEGRSATPLWIGAALFIAAFSLIVG